MQVSSCKRVNASFIDHESLLVYVTLRVIHDSADFLRSPPVDLRFFRCGSPLCVVRPSKPAVLSFELVQRQQKNCSGRPNRFLLVEFYWPFTPGQDAFHECA